MNSQPRSSNVQYVDVDKLCDEAEAAGLAWADASAAADALEVTRKSVLAHSMAGFLQEGMPANKAETFALAQESYMDFIKRMVSARKAADRARVHYDVLKTRIELIRTNASTERAAMGMR
jgi:hypothetical protein